MTLLSATSTLLQNLKDLAAKQVATDYLCIKSKHEHGLKNVVIQDLQMAILLEGEKTFYLNDLPLNCKVGNVLFIKPSGVIEVTNIPDNQTGKYLTIQVPICREVIEATQLIWAQPILDKNLQVLQFPLADLSDQLSQWYQALLNDDWAKARMALTQILLQLCHQGYTDLLITPPLTPAHLIYQWVVSNPDYNWQSEDFEQRLTMSGATLRRRLTAENTTLRQIITKARLGYAMSLLYSTSLPLKAVAAKSGYQSVAVFRQRFKAQYGIEPKMLGNA